MNNKFIDLHSHTLWGIDDGARNLDETVSMCDLAADSGTRTLFLTPHLIHWDRAEDLFDERNEKAEYLSKILWENDIELDLKTGFEILCDDDIFNIKYFNPFTLCGSKYLLVEFDFFNPTPEEVLIWCSYIQSFGLVPIIAHPERYRFMLLNNGLIDKLSQKGVLFQINAGSPAGAFGDAVASFSRKMIKGGFVDFIGSDAHSRYARNTDMSACFDYYPDDSDLEELLDITYSNSLKVIENKDIKIRRLSYFLEM